MKHVDRNNLNGLVVIPARGGSKGVPKKNIKILGGNPLIYYSIRSAQDLGEKLKVFVSTDSEDIAAVARGFGADVPVLRPNHLSGDAVGDMPVLKDALNEARKFYEIDFDYVVMLQPTSPFRPSSLLNNAIDKLFFDQLDSVWSAKIVDLKYHPLKQLVVDKDTGQIKYFDDRGFHVIRRQELEPTLMRDGRIYALTSAFVETSDNLMGNRSGYVVDDSFHCNIDTFDDFAEAEKMSFLLAGQ